MCEERILSFVKDFEHPAWGIGHFERVYKLSLEIADKQGINIDEKSIFAAAYLHDIGAFKPYKMENIDHAERSADICEDILNSVGFPKEKIALVQEIIRNHMFYTNFDHLKASPEVVVFHDADVLEFMGTIGIARLISIVGIDDWTPSLRSAIELIEKLSAELVEKLHTDVAKEIGKARKAEMESFLLNFSNQTDKLITI